MDKIRIDQAMVELGLVPSRSQAESYIKMGKVSFNARLVTKAGQLVYVDSKSRIKLAAGEQYVSRAALKLESVANGLKLNFRNKTVLDVGSSTGGFSDFALKQGANRVIAVEKGTDQMNPVLKTNPRIELHEKTDIRDFKTKQKIDIVVIDVSFISLREILPYVSRMVSADAQIVAMVKPQFEAVNNAMKHKGVIKNDKMRRTILKDFEIWAKQYFIIKNKLDSSVSGSKGNLERFYLLQKA